MRDQRSVRSVILAFAMLALGWIAHPASAADANERLKYAIAVHGGAGPWANRTPERTAAILKEIEAALKVGQKILAEGGASLDAVEQTVRYLEDCPLFNAGKGATFNDAGGHELDASIMRGEDLAAGAVGAVTVVKHPISLARRVMTDTKHILLVSEGANAFAREMGVEMVAPDYFWTEKTRAEWEKERTTQSKRAGAGNRLALDADDGQYDTVGCVALDAKGNLAAGTSTGGLKMKRVGRVGDSPLIGAGNYADNRSCAVSGTGVGEQWIRHAAAYDVSARMLYLHEPLARAVQVQVDERLPAETAGLIAVGADGEIAVALNTKAMPRGMADSSGRFEVLIEKP